MVLKEYWGGFDVESNKQRVKHLGCTWYIIKNKIEHGFQELISSYKWFSVLTSCIHFTSTQILYKMLENAIFFVFVLCSTSCILFIVWQLCNGHCDGKHIPSLKGGKPCSDDSQCTFLWCSPLCGAHSTSPLMGQGCIGKPQFK